MFLFKLSLTQLGASVGVCIQFNMVGRLPAAKHSYSPVIAVWLIGGLLWQARARSSFSTTLKALNKLISLSIETAFPTVTVAAAELITFMKYPGENYDILLCTALTEYFSYVNALLGVLNRRVELRRILAGSITSADIRAVIPSNNRISEADPYYPPTNNFNFILNDLSQTQKPVSTLHYYLPHPNNCLGICFVIFSNSPERVMIKLLMLLLARGGASHYVSQIYCNGGVERKEIMSVEVKYNAKPDPNPSHV
ncbi:hypothetical protein BDQ17DRAFT_1330705 [Cyathus striatus]|nr:hypothetical protein BDQ17DRAFT_1330705 [Cyathus striatus]